MLCFTIKAKSNKEALNKFIVELSGSLTRVRCGYSLYDDDWPLHYNAFTLELPEPHNAIEGQYEILLTLQKDDIIVFEGVLKDILIRKSPLGDEWVSLDFSDVVIKSVNGTEV